MRESPTNPSASPAPVTRAFRALPPGIWALGFVSMFMDTSSELMHSLLPIFMSSVLGASMLTIGMIEGIAEATAAVTKMFSGTISDYLGKRKALVLLGYALSAITKPVFPLASDIGWVFAARFVDRIGKGIRGAPRDALIADLVPPPQRGTAYGLRQALDSVGAFIGPLLAVVFMLWLADNLREVLWVAVVPAFLAVLVLVVAVREPSRRSARQPNRVTFAGMKRLSPHYWWTVALGAVFTLARFSEAFLILRARDVGLAIDYAPLIMVVMNVVYAICAYPAGVAADRLSARTLLLLGLAVLVLADTTLALSASPAPAFVGAALWGLHMSLTQGLLSKLVADTAPGRLRGTAFGIFNLISGVSLLLASVVAGALWEAFGAATTFVAGAAFAALAIVGLALYRPGNRPAAGSTRG
ncbi:MAG: MFS transporter [Xanthomonadaceae bacterium]|nr:MFS transporter [Xanthomonadaceae bacterium]MDE3073304.1 MFS transporter [Pseudomonadota bacterium]